MEFLMAGIPTVFILISTVDLSLGMWQYHTLARAIKEGTRYLVPRGVDCTLNSNTCSTTVGAVASKIAAEAIGIPATSLNVTLTSQSGQTQTCNPLSSCYSSSTVWPPSTNGDNAVGKLVTIKGTLAGC